MEYLQPGQIVQFMKRFAFRGGRIARFNLKQGKDSASALMLLKIRTHAGQPVRLKLEFQDVVEYRFQRRPYHQTKGFADVRLANFEGAFFLNLDAFAEDGIPQLMDFRNSEAYIAASRLGWEIIQRKEPDAARA